MNERENRFPLTCAASSSSGCARQQVLISSLASSWSAVALCLLLIAAGTNFALAQNTSQMFLRLAGPATSFIEGGSFYSGLLLWTNALPGLAYRLQTRTDLGPDGKWNNYRVYHATGVQMVVNTATPDDNLVTAPVPAGAFQMGDALGDGFANERPVHTVNLGALQVDRFEVYWALWSEVRTWALSKGYDFDGSGSAVDNLAPVTAISWYDCVKWCNARSEKAGLPPVYYLTSDHTNVYRSGHEDLTSDCVAWDKAGYRLPTEAEWERLARGGAEGYRFPWTNVLTIAHTQANYSSRTNEAYDLGPTRGYHPSFQGDPSPVGTFAPNGYGVYDTAGNVWEWCWDWFSQTCYTALPADNPKGPATGSARVARGDSYYNVGFYARCAYRNFWAPANRFGDFGFRCVRTVP